ncbi:hypothetical protein AGMMS50218_08220 [Actinomycetota bacterium]|nr:hypothetical protein AGMMS50218_08220 [Actinomycetota bacterium]
MCHLTATIGGVAVTVQDLLELDVLARARPEVVHGTDLGTREVRWVHTSEIYDISPLLKGGEVLLTTGLGLVAGGRAAFGNYVAALAQRRIAALFLEVGRTFPEVPAELVAAARAVDLPLVVLHGVVPFIEVTETVHPLLISDEVTALRTADRVTHALNERLLDGSGLGGLTDAVAALAGCPVRLLASDGEPVTGTPADPRPGDALDPGTAPPADLHRPVVVLGEPWGTIVLDGAPTALREVVADRAATAVAIEVLRSGATAPARREARARLLRDIVDGRYASSIELTSRAAGVGLVVDGRRRAVAICLATSHGTPPRTGVTAAAEAARRVFGPALVAEIDDDVVVAAATEVRDLRAAVARFADEIDAELRATTGGHVTAVTAAQPTPDIAGLVGSVPSAREASALARRILPSARVLLVADLGMYRLLAQSVRDDDLELFVQEQLGPLLAHDAVHGTELVRTLDAYLGAGLSKVAAAEALGIRRQSMYGRLDRVVALLGGPDLADRERRTALDLALVAWRLRTAAVGVAPSAVRHLPVTRRA